MENKKGLGVIGLVVLCLAVSALFGIAYAGFSSNLSVSGSATVNANTWKVAWAAITDNSSTTQPTLPTITADGSVTTINNWSGTFSKYGDVVSFTVTAQNFGTFGAELDSVKNSSNVNITSSNIQDLVTCEAATSSNATSSDIANVKADLTLSIKKGSDDIWTYVGGTVGTLAAYDSSNVSASQETYTFTLTYAQSDSTDTEGAKLPSDAVKCTVSQVNFNYKQA